MFKCFDVTLMAQELYEIHCRAAPYLIQNYKIKSTQANPLR